MSRDYTGTELARLTRDSTSCIEGLLGSLLEEIRGLRDELCKRAKENPPERDEYGNLL